MGFVRVGKNLGRSSVRQVREGLRCWGVRGARAGRGDRLGGCRKGEGVDRQRVRVEAAIRAVSGVGGHDPMPGWARAAPWVWAPGCGRGVGGGGLRLPWRRLPAGRGRARDHPPRRPSTSVPPPPQRSPAQLAQRAAAQPGRGRSGRGEGADEEPPSPCRRRCGRRARGRPRGDAAGPLDEVWFAGTVAGAAGTPVRGGSFAGGPGDTCCLSGTFQTFVCFALGRCPINCFFTGRDCHGFRGSLKTPVAVTLGPQGPEQNILFWGK